MREAAKKYFYSGPATKRGGGKGQATKGGVKALVVGPLIKNFFYFSFPNIRN